jgi:SAM-dependent methyltransferase
LIDEKWLNLACGQIRVDHLDLNTQQKDGVFFGIDISKNDAVDAVVDLEWFPWPIKSESVEEIICSHYVEHTSNLIAFMDEVYRILKPEGKIKVIAPYYTSIRCWQDPTHKRAISEATFLYFNKNWRDMNKLDHYDIKSDFDFTYGYDISADWASRSQEARDFAMKYYWNVINDIHVVLTKRT